MTPAPGPAVTVTLRGADGVKPTDATLSTGPATATIVKTTPKSDALAAKRDLVPLPM
jgi:hypothetical protein